MEAMTREEWIQAAADKLRPYEGDVAAMYAESLYQTYVVEDGARWANDPAGAVSMDMSYWGD